MSYLKKFILLTLLSFSIKIAAQVFPQKNITLKYLQVMFQYPQYKYANLYAINLYEIDKATQLKKLIYTITDSSTAHLLTHYLEFNKSYVWHYSAIYNDKIIFTSKEFYFNTANTRVISCFKSNITINDSSNYDKGLVFLDQGLVIDRKGKIILITDSFGIEKRDFMHSNTGSITYLFEKNAYDISLNSEILWHTKPITHNKQLIFEYHHDVTKLSNGNYLVMCKISEPFNPKFNNQLNEAIVELTPKNEVVWLWEEHEHITDTQTVKHTHLNSIFLDERLNELYVSARDINTIIVIDRKTGNVIKTIGAKLSKEAENYEQLAFNGQHSVQLLPNNNILVFNNNTAPNKGKITSVIEINNPDKNFNYVENRFFYMYDFGKPEYNLCTKGGDANKLTNGNYIISSSAYNRNFEINQTGTIVWECRPEKLDSTGASWIGVGSYRINFAKDLYPYFFTIEKNYTSNKVTGIKICNKGSENDEYQIEIYNKNGTPINKLTIGVLAHKYISLNEPLKRNYIIKITPVSNILNFKLIKL